MFDACATFMVTSVSFLMHTDSRMIPISYVILSMPFLYYQSFSNCGLSLVAYLYLLLFKSLYIFYLSILCIFESYSRPYFCRIPGPILSYSRPYFCRVPEPISVVFQSLFLSYSSTYFCRILVPISVVFQDLFVSYSSTYFCRIPVPISVVVQDLILSYSSTCLCSIPGHICCLAIYYCAFPCSFFLIKPTELFSRIITI